MIKSKIIRLCWRNEIVRLPHICCSFHDARPFSNRLMVPVIWFFNIHFRTEKAQVVGEAISSIFENLYTEYSVFLKKKKHTTGGYKFWSCVIAVEDCCPAYHRFAEGCVPWAPRREVTYSTKKYRSAKFGLYVPPKFLRDILRWRARELTSELARSLLSCAKIPSKFYNFPHNFI